jgi:cytochrome c oxidase subunit 1
MLRRTSDPYFYGDLQGMLPMNQLMTICALGLGAAQIILAINFFWSIFKGKKCESRNPWEANTLEWCTPTPPVDHGNFDIIPHVYRGPYEYGVEGDTDHLPQFQPPAGVPAPKPVAAH